MFNVFISGAWTENRNSKANSASSRWEHQKAPGDAPKQGDG